MSVGSGTIPDFITEFLAYTEDTPSPEVFRLWAGISCLAGALERKVWLRVSGKTLYPHMYVVLVGPPATGKNFVSNIAEELWRSTKDHFVAPKSFSFASLGDALKDSVRRIIRPAQVPPYDEFNSLIVHSRELKVILPEYNSIIMDRLTDLWDGGIWDERLRGGGINYIIEKPQVHLLAGETPSYFNSVIPDNAWEGGFLSRTILVYAGTGKRTSLFSTTVLPADQFKKLEKILKHKGALYGEMTIDRAAEKLIEDWWKSGAAPFPEHPKFIHYNSRRHMHLIKLCMVSAISRSDKFHIEAVDFERALGWLAMAEADIEDIFKAAPTQGDGKVIEEAWYFLYREFTRTKKPIRGGLLTRFVSARVPSHTVARVIEVMESGGYIKKTIGDDGQYYYTPLSKQGDD